MLADACADDAVALRLAVDAVDDVLRQHIVRLADGDRWVVAAHLLDPLEPGAALFGLDVLVQLGQPGLQIAMDRRRRAHVLADLCRVDVDVHDLCLRREVLEAAGHAVVEANAQADQKVRLVDCAVVPVHAMHPGHTQVQRMCPRKAADAQ